MKIITNNNWRRFIDGEHNVPRFVLDDYNHLPEEEKCYGWIKYKKTWYHISDFMRCDTIELKDSGYDGYITDSFFSGVLIKIDDLNDLYKVATFYSEQYSSLLWPTEVG